MNSMQRGRLIVLIKQHFPYTEPCDVDHALQWEIIADTLNALGPSQTTDQWIEEWKSIRHSAEEKFNAINSKDKDKIMDLKLSEEDHRVIKLCGFKNDTDKMAELVKMLDCRAVSPFQNESLDDSDSKDERNSPTRKVEADEYSNKNNIGELKVDRNVALEQLTEQKKINDQLSELLAILKMPSQNLNNSK